MSLTRWSRAVVILTLGGFLLAATASSGQAQEITRKIFPPEERAEFEEQPNGGFTINGDAIPKSLVFDTLLIEASFLLRDRQFRQTYLEMIGMEGNEGAVAALEAAAEVADELRSRPFIDHSLEGDEYLEFQFRAQAARARELGRLYVRLLRQLEATGYPPADLLAHMEGPVRGGSSLWVTGPENRAAHLEQNEALRKAFEEGASEEEFR